MSPGAVHKCQQLQQPDTRGGKHFSCTAFRSPVVLRHWKRKELTF